MSLEKKYGIISYEKKPIKLNGNDVQNMGEWLQMFAVEYLFREWGIKETLHISRNEASRYSGDSCVVFVNGYNTCNNARNLSTNTFPLPAKIKPVFLSFHFCNRYIPAQLKEQLVMHAPIGCRDEETRDNLRNHGISAYTTGCVSALLPKRSAEAAANADKVFFVDTPERLMPFVPSNIRQKAEFVSNLYPLTRTDGEPIMTEEESRCSCAYAAERYKKYYYEAKLIVTSRLHVAAPAVAMGIPCILVAENFDGRYAWLDKWLPLYTSDKFDKIDWNPQQIEYEEEKKRIKDGLRKIFLEQTDKEEELKKIDTYFNNRTRGNYNTVYRNALMKYSFLPYNTKYAIWGTIEGKSNQLKFSIEEIYPRWEFVGIYDKYVQGNFEGHIIQSSENIEDSQDMVYFVMSPAIYKEAKMKVKKGKIFFVDITNGLFEGNF
ncbi:MAG: polysaccharide pyruvyl transferase family protein [Lachnospiraceae bacterium]|nr:polysaccharide pyruvyl transferase family protein [Lachnospiraceae bacterium]